jgi:dTDP-4-amino-4,6-dideoxygalactose transaminase
MAPTRPRLYLSPPHVAADEQALVRDAIASNWIAPLGPHVDAFEREVAAAVGVRHAAALSSGTAALHLALQIVGVRPGDTVLCPTLTFVASVSPVVWLGARPVLVDSERASWNLDPDLVAEELDTAARRGTPPKAVVPVHLYGQTANLGPILDACRRHGVAVIEDAAEALGATYLGRGAGSLGRAGILSFNGNKIITTSGGGMLVSDDEAVVKRARFLATQARDPAPHYEHSELGNNYRMSNILAALGRGQLRTLGDRVERRRRNFSLYQEALRDVPGVSFMPEAPWGRATRWLSVILVHPLEFGATRESVRLHLESSNIEARPVWKPMHLQPVFRDTRVVGGSVAESLFEKGLCLPSGSQMSDSDVGRVVDTILSTPRATSPSRAAFRTGSTP